MSKNIEKYEIYKIMKVQLKKSLTSGFYYQAIFIEYAILEDRANSVLRHAHLNTENNKGEDLSISRKLNKLKSCKPFSDSSIRKKLPIEFIEEITAWKKQRDDLIHTLAKIKYDDESVRETALCGKELIDKFDNTVKRLNKILDNRYT